jgi:ferredoxin-NADP reductase
MTHATELDIAVVRKNAGRQPMQDRFIDAVIHHRRDLTDRIAEFTIARRDGLAMPQGEAGAHIELRFGGAAGGFLRHYSLVGPLDRTTKAEPFLRIAVQREDRARGSAYIHANFSVGSPLRVSHPIGAFRLGRNLPHVLLVAGGIGITAMLPMLRSLAIRRQPFTMDYFGRRRADMAYADEVLALGGTSARLHDASLSGMPDLAALLAAQPPGTVAYVCGPGPMIDALRDAAATLGWTPDRVRFEVFNAAHRPNDAALAVRTRSGRRVMVGAGTTILDALEAARIDTLSDCRRGECGLCVTDILGCEGQIDHRDHCLTPEDRSAGTKIAICCSRVTGGVLTLDL